MDESRKPANVEEYIQAFPEDVQQVLQKIRRIIHEAAPEVKETISYGMPTFKLNGNLVHFAAYKTHIGFYPSSSGIAAFEQELSDYDYSKGTVRFPIGTPVPYDLIQKIVEFRVQEVTKK